MSEYSDFIGFLTNQKETAVMPEPTLLERAKAMRLKHLPGQHDQGAHGHGGGFDADSFVAEITKLPVGDRITRMKKLTPEERDKVTAVMGRQSGITSTPKKPEKVYLRREREPYAKSGYVWRARIADSPLYMSNEDKKLLMAQITQTQPVSEFVDE